MKQKKRGKSQFTYKARWLSFHKQRKHNNEFLARVRTLQRWCTFCFHNLHTQPLLLPKERMKFKDLRKKTWEIFQKKSNVFPKTSDIFEKSSEFSYPPLPQPQKHCNHPQLLWLLTHLLFHPNLPLLRGLFAHVSRHSAWNIKKMFIKHR